MTAAASIAEAGLDRTDTAIAAAAFVAVGSITVAGSVLFYLVAPNRAERPLAAVKQFMSDNNAVIMMVILLLLGAKLLGDGLAASEAKRVRQARARRRQTRLSLVREPGSK